LDGVGDKALALGFIQVRRQQTDPWIHGQVKRLRVQRGEGPGDQAGLQVEQAGHIDDYTERGGGGHTGAEGRATGGHRNDHAAEAHVAELEGAPVQVWIELFGDDDRLRRRRGRGFVFKVDGVGEEPIRLNKAAGAKAGGDIDAVGVN
jgi:hypothetical protein